MLKVTGRNKVQDCRGSRGVRGPDAQTTEAVFRILAKADRLGGLTDHTQLDSDFPQSHQL